MSCKGGRHESASTSGRLQAFSLKTKFVNFIEFGSHNKEIEDYKEVGERLLTWAKIRYEPVESYQNHMGALYKPVQAIKNRDK